MATAPRIDEKLNLVVPLMREDGRTLHVYSTPISEDIFGNFYDVISRVFNKLYAPNGIGMFAGPKVSYFALRDICIADGTWEGKDGVENLLCGEIWRLTNVLAPGAKGWDTIQFEDAEKMGIMTPREVREVKNVLIFFTVNFCMHNQSVIRIIMKVSEQTWGARATPLTCTEYRDSLPMLTADGNTGATVAAS